MYFAFKTCALYVVGMYCTGIQIYHIIGWMINLSGPAAVEGNMLLVSIIPKKNKM